MDRTNTRVYNNYNFYSSLMYELYFNVFMFGQMGGALARALREHKDLFVSTWNTWGGIISF